MNRINDYSEISYDASVDSENNYLKDSLLNNDKMKNDKKTD